MTELINILTPSQSIKDIVRSEGDPLVPSGGRFAVASFTKADGTPGTNSNGPSGLLTNAGFDLFTVGNFLSVPSCRSVFLENLILSSNKKVSWNIFLQRNYLTAGTAPTSNFPMYGEPSGAPIVLEINDFITGRLASNLQGGLTAFIRQVFDADLTGCEFYMGATGWSLNNDLNFSAPKTILHIGDSITRLETGSISISSAYQFAVTNYFKNRAINCRQITKAYSGATSASIEDLRTRGGLDVGKTHSLITYNLGVNDAIAGISKDDYKANVKAIIGWKQKIHPNSRMIILGPTPVENNTVESLLVQYRAEALAAVNEASDNRILFCNLGSSFDRTVASNYASTDVAGSRIHPSNAGHNALSTTVINFLNSNLTSI